MDQAEATSPSPRGGGGGIHWEAHGRLLTAGLVALNVFLVLLVYVYFWRFFSRSRGGGGGEDDDDVEGASSVASSPPASPKARDRREVQLAITALPVFVHSSSSGEATGGGGPAAECAICIAEFADGDEGRLLPRCGHRFHARCVDTWFRFYTTCPLCRATVLADATPPPAPPETANQLAAAQAANQPPHQQFQHHTDTLNSTDADTDSPV